MTRSVRAPPRQRSVSSAWAAGRSTFTITSASRVRSSSLRSRALVVGAVHTCSQVAAQAVDEPTLLRGQSAGSAVLTGSQLRFGRGHLLQPLLPLPLEATGHQAVLSIDGSVTAFGARGFIARPLDGHTGLGKRCIMIGFQALSGR